MEGLSFDNILDADDIENLFTEETQDTSPESEDTNETTEDTTEVDVNTLFDQSESVGSEENNKEKEEPESDKDSSTSPNTFYSSITRALQEEGIFPDLDDDTISKINTPEDFKKLFEEQIQAGIEEKNKRIDKALSYGVKDDVVRNYENTLNFLDSIQEETLKDESEKGEKLRKDLIFQDFINRGYSKERAHREVEKSFNAGTDIDDAREALSSNKEFFNDAYNKVIEDAKKKEEESKEGLKREATKLKESIIDSKELFGDLSVDKSTRQKIYDNITKPVHRDPKTGEYYTAIQKYEKENKVEFLKHLSLFYTLTNGFKDITPLIKNKVNKEVKKGVKALEQTINNTVRSSDGNIRFVGIGDPESSARGWSIDV